MPATDKTYHQRPGLRYLIITTLLFLSFSLQGCIESIDFDSDRSGFQLVVDGRITNGPGPHQLLLGYTSVDKTTTLPLSGASITIYDDQGNSESFVEGPEGEYYLYGNSVQGVSGRTYYIDIQLVNGNTYRSRPETLPAIQARDSIYYKIGTVEEVSRSGKVTEAEAIEIYLDTSVPETPEPFFLKWSVEEDYKFTEYDYPDPFNAPPLSCYVKQFPNPQVVHLFSSENSGVSKIEGQLMAVRKIDFTFYQRHYFNVIQSSITREAYEYWRQADQVVNSQGTIFDVPPSVPRGNIYNIDNENEQVLGYFETARYDTVRLFVLRHQLPVHVGEPCARIRPNRPPYCNSCLDLPHSSREAPFYWLKE